MSNTGECFLFTVLDAVMGTTDKPATHNMPRDCRLLMIAMGNHGERCWAAVETLALKCDIGKSTVRVCLADLEAHKWIRWTGEWHGKGGHATKVYEIHAFGEAWNEDRKATRARLPPPGSQTSRSQPPPSPGSQPSTAWQSDSQGVAVRPPGDGDKPLLQPPKEPLQETSPVAPAHEHAREDVQGERPKPTVPFVPSEPTAKAEDTFKLTSPGGEETKPAKKRRQPAAPVPEDPSTLTPRERAAYDAIASDPSLQPITRGVVQLARDLAAVAPLVDLATEIRRAGMWLRGDPSDPRRRKKNGNAFLDNWIQRQQVDLAARPQPAPKPDPFEGRTRPAHLPADGPPVPKAFLERRKRDAEALARGESLPSVGNPFDLVAQIGANMDRIGAPSR